MTDTWYRKIIQPVIDSDTDILFIIDPDEFTEYPAIKEILSEKYPIIERFTNELKLRRNIRKKRQRMLIIFFDEKDIPFDLISTFATVDINITDLFPLLNSEALLNIPYDNYQTVHEEYKKLKERRYERLSKWETETFIKAALSSDTLVERKRISELKSRLDKLLNFPIAGIRDWAKIFGEISKFFGELMFISHARNINFDVEEMERKINNTFKLYAMDYEYYQALAYDGTSPLNSNIITRIFRNGVNKTALICFDCMGFEEWNAIKEFLESKLRLEFEINYSFSMLPSETKYSSSALFAGLAPKDIKDLKFIKEMHWLNEERLFRYTLNEGLGRDRTRTYFKRCLDASEIPIPYESLRDYDTIGLVFSFIDRFIHNNLMNKSLLIKNIQMHLEKSKVDELIIQLLEQGFRIYLTSDHGSILSTGNGINVSKDLVDTKAKRYLLSDRKELLEEYTTEDSVLIQLKNIIGEDFVLLLTENSMFASKNEQSLTHGGISIEEVVIPFIEVKYK